jgi:hypothetical protein
LTVAVRKVSRRAAVARHRRDIFRKELTQGICGTRRKEMVAASRKMTRRAGVAWSKRAVVRRDCARSKVQRANRRVEPLRKSVRTHHERRGETKDLDGKRPLYLRKRATVIRLCVWSTRVITYWKRTTDLQDLQGDPRAGSREAKRRDIQRVTKNDRPDIAEWSTTSIKEK